MWLHLGTALFLLCAILCMVYLVAQQISRPLRRLARVMDTVRRTGDQTQRASWDSQDEIGQLVRGFNEMLEQLDHERDVQKELAATTRAAEAQQALVEATPVPMMVTSVPGHGAAREQADLAWLGGRMGDPRAHGLDSAVRARFFQQLSDREAIDQFEVQWKAGKEPTWAMLSARRLSFQGQDAILTAFSPSTSSSSWSAAWSCGPRCSRPRRGHPDPRRVASPAERQRVLLPLHRRYNIEDVLAKPPGFLLAGAGGEAVFASISGTGRPRQHALMERRGPRPPAALGG